LGKLDQLIERLCPDGVAFIKLKEVAEIRSGWGFPNKEQGLGKGDLPFYKVGDMNYPINRIWMSDAENYVSYETADRLKCNPAPAQTIVFPKIGAAIKTNKVRILSCQACYDNNMMGIIAKKNILSKFLFYLFEKCELMSFANGEGAVPSIRKTTVEDWCIPIPPLEIQQEIVRILDNFTELTTELTKELTAELEARKKQYEYYREKLIFGQNYPMVELRSVVKNHYTGATPKKGTEAFYEGGTIPWIRTQDVRFNEITSVDSYITESAVALTGAKWIPENCVIVAISGASAGRCAINKFPATTNQHCLNMEIDPEVALYKYVYYAVSCQYEELLSRKQGARGDLNSSLILGISIPLPSLDDQRWIVDTLNNFDTLIADLSEDLPSEITARQKQYEYYRDKLLTFKRKEAP